MKRLQYYVATSVDGFIARADGSFDFLFTDGDHVPDFIASFAWFDTVLMGRHTYDVGLAAGVTNPYPMLKSYVFSRSLETSPDPAVTLVRDDAAGVVRELKRGEGKDIWLCGGADLARTLFDADLIDEVVVKINPVIVGSGIPLFKVGADERKTIRLELGERKIYNNGVILAHYRVLR